MADDTQTVYVSRGWSRRKKTYHLNKHDCPSAVKAHNLQETTKAEAEQRGLRECKSCTREYEHGNYDNSFQKALKAAAQGEADD